jgi:hypothetical protein
LVHSAKIFSKSSFEIPFSQFIGVRVIIHSNSTPAGTLSNCLGFASHFKNLGTLFSLFASKKSTLPSSLNFFLNSFVISKSLKISLEAIFISFQAVQKDLTIFEELSISSLGQNSHFEFVE